MNLNVIKALLFVFLGIPGGLAFVTSLMLILIKLGDPKAIHHSYLSLFCVFFISSIMTLIGVGKLREWKYIFVFLSFPLSFIVAGTIGYILHPVLMLPGLACAMFLIPYAVKKAVSKHYDKKKDST